MNLFGGKGDDLTTDLMIETQRKASYRFDGSPGDNWQRSGGGGGGGGIGALPHPMMMPGHQNLMTNYFSPALMMKTPNFNSDYASLPPAVNFSNLLMEQEEIDGGGGRAPRSLSDKHR